MSVLARNVRQEADRTALFAMQFTNPKPQPCSRRAMPARLAAALGGLFGPVLTAACLLFSAQGAHASALFDLLTGEYNNNEQVWQGNLDGVATIQRRHWRFERLAPGRLSLATGPGQSAPDPAWILVMDAEGLHSVVLPIGSETPVCQYQWQAEGAGYRGEARPRGSCPADLPAIWQVDDTHLTSHAGADEAAEALRARRVHRYRGWAVLQRQRLEPDADPDDMIFMPDLRLHDEGYVVPITDDGRETGYAFELARLTYQNTRVSVLKLGVIEQSSGKTLRYAWTEPLSPRIGINLRWLQVGLTLEQQPSPAPADR